MDAVVQLLTLLFGFILGFILYEFARYRLGGIVAIPIMVIYTLENPLMLPIFFSAICVCLLCVNVIAEKTLLYGRRLLYLNLAVSIVTTSALIFSLSTWFNMDLTTLTVGTIFPGIMAFNISRETYDVPTTVKSIGMMLCNFLAVLLFGIGLSLLTGGAVYG